jgi:hypothetical protein
MMTPQFDYCSESTLSRYLHMVPKKTGWFKFEAALRQWLENFIVSQATDANQK